MRFEEMDRIFPSQRIWGAREIPFSFIILEEEGLFEASARRVYLGGEHFTPGKVERLGEFGSFEEARKACESFQSRR